MIALGAVQRRQPLRLGLGNLYILPTRFGVLWLAGMALLQWNPAAAGAESGAPSAAAGSWQLRLLLAPRILLG